MEDRGDDDEWPRSVRGNVECEALEEAVHCSICRDYFDTPLSLHCGHSFCSGCIRSNIQFQERNSSKAFCPQCREPTDSRQIHPNHQLREIVKHFLLARRHLIVAMAASSNNGQHSTGTERRKRKSPEKERKNREHYHGKQPIGTGDIIQLDSTSEQDERSKTHSRQLRRRSTPVEYFPQQDQNSDEGDEEDQDSDAEVVEDSEASDLDVDLDYESPLKKSKPSQPEKQPSKSKKQQKGGPDGVPHNWARCPICSDTFPMAIFNDHIDKCLMGSGQNGGGVETKPSGSKKKLQVPPKLLLSLEKDKSLKDRLKKYGLSTKGTRQELEQRYTRFRLEVQSAMDRNEAGVNYESLAKRITGREVSEAQAGNKPLLRASHAPKKAATGQASEFEDLIKATRARDSGKLGSTSTPVIGASERDEGTLAAGEDTEVSSQPKVSASKQIEHQPASSSLPAAGFRRPARV